MAERLIFMGMPAGNGFINAGAAQGLFQLGTQRYKAVCATISGSALGQTFNKLWASALSHPGATHFAMLHSDVVPSHWWVDTLIDELDRTGADVVSAVCRIKDTKGFTSTGVGDPADQWDYRRITCDELTQLPETFGAEDIPPSITDGYRTCLLVNTGCWVCRLDRPWWRELDEEGKLRFCFTQNDRVAPMPTGQYLVEFAPEDWLFSRYCQAVGAKVLATQKVGLRHVGVKGFGLDVESGQLATDTEAVAFHSDKPLSTRKLVTETGAWLTQDGTFHRHDVKFEEELCKFFTNGHAGQSVFDIGCGEGSYVRWLSKNGVEAAGVDGNPNTPERTGGQCEVADISQPIDHPADWVLCLEVGEHVPVEHEEAVFNNICNNARRGLIVSWAEPGQGGLGHINEQPLDFVRKRIEARGFSFDLEATERFRSGSTLPWFQRNIQVFERNIPCKT